MHQAWLPVVSCKHIVVKHTAHSYRQWTTRTRDARCFSRKPQKNEPLVVLVRKMLGIKGDGDVARVMRVFLDVDLRGTHKLDIETFFEYFDIEFSEYNKRAFRLLAFGDEQVLGKLKVECRVETDRHLQALSCNATARHSPHMFSISQMVRNIYTCLLMLPCTTLPGEKMS